MTVQEALDKLINMPRYAELVILDYNSTKLEITRVCNSVAPDTILICGDNLWKNTKKY